MVIINTIGVGLVVAILIFFIIGIVLGEYGHFALSTLTWLGSLAIIDYFWSVGIFASIVSNPILSIVYLFGYLMIGAIYTAVLKWPRYLNKVSYSIQDAYKRFIRQNPGESFDKFLDSDYYSQFTPQNNKDRIANWVSMWVFTAVWDLIHRPTKYIYGHLYKLFAGFYNNIGRSTTKKILARNTDTNSNNT